MNGANAVVVRRLESQRDNLMTQSYNLDQVAFAAESMKDAHATVSAGREAGREGGREGGTGVIPEDEAVDGRQQCRMDVP